MFFVDKPYVSDFLKKTLVDNKIPVVNTKITKDLNLYAGTNLISENEAIEIIKKSKYPIVYTTSENSIGWISKYLSFCNLPKKIEIFKDKAKFRKLTKSIFPNFYFREVYAKELNKIDFDELPLPFIIKPTVGFFSMGVYKINNIKEYNCAIDSITSQINQAKNIYPKEVLDTNSFIIEECINGEEFAIDAYFNSDKEVVILGIFKHLFSSDGDVGDRVYISSKNIIEKNIEEFTDFIEQIGKIADVKNFPIHVELRRDNNGALLPIEVNPMRFGGWCSTADVTFLAYGFNPYVYYYLQKKPNWSEVLKDKKGKIFSIIVLDNSTGINVNEIAFFDYEKLLLNFEKPLELRKIDYKKYPVFGFLFAQTRENNLIELEKILNSDLTEFVSKQ